MGYRTLDIETKDHVTTITVRPEQNAIEVVAWELDGACSATNDDAETHAVVLVLQGGALSSGAEGRPGEAPFACLESMGQPVVCAVQDDAIGGALEMALACDVRICSDAARFGFDGMPRAGGSQRLPRLVGRGEAMRLLLLGETIDAEEAQRIGLVNAVHPRTTLLQEATALAQRMASRGPLALRYAKEAVRRGLEMPLDQALRYETDLTVILQTTEDRAEGVRAFLEKREPEFKGR